MFVLFEIISEPGMVGRGGEVARWALTKTTETFRISSFNDGNGSKCEKYFLASFSSDGM